MSSTGTHARKALTFELFRTVYIVAYQASAKEISRLCHLHYIRGLVQLCRQREGVETSKWTKLNQDPKRYPIT